MRFNAVFTYLTLICCTLQAFIEKKTMYTHLQTTNKDFLFEAQRPSTRKSKPVFVEVPVFTGYSVQTFVFV